MAKAGRGEDADEEPVLRPETRGGVAEPAAVSAEGEEMTEFYNRSMTLPHKHQEFMAVIARETARMSYPGSMSRGATPVVYKGTKRLLEDYYAKKFPLADVWSCSDEIASSYDAWHQKRTREIATALKDKVPEYNNPQGVATKFLNTFMHQLMKYECCRPLWDSLHLALDARVFASLRRLRAPSLSGIQTQLTSSPYKQDYSSYLDVQRALLDLVDELNDRPGVEFHISSRIELNWLWV